MPAPLRKSVLALSRRVHFRGKGRLLELVGLGPTNRDLVPPGVTHVDTVGGITIHTSCPRDVMFRALYWDGCYQDDVLAALRGLLRPGGVFWDVGANYGLMSIYVDRIFDGAVRSIAFEPSPIVLKELERNLEANGCTNVGVEKMCLSDRSGTVKFYTSPDFSWNATIIPEFAERAGEDVEMEVPSSTIDACVERLPHPTCIKLDVEGAEHLVIQGGERFLARADVPIVAEYNVQAIRDAGLKESDYLRLYKDLGYRPHILPRPLWGLCQWRDLQRVEDESALPSLCNLVLLKGDAPPAAVS